MTLRLDRKIFSIFSFPTKCSKKNATDRNPALHYFGKFDERFQNGMYQYMWAQARFTLLVVYSNVVRIAYQNVSVAV